MIQRRSLLISGATTALGALISGKATASTRGSTPHLPPLRKGARLRAINPGTWIEPDTAFDARASNAVSGSIQVPGLMARKRAPLRRGGK